MQHYEACAEDCAEAQKSCAKTGKGSCDGRSRGDVATCTLWLGLCLWYIGCAHVHIYWAGVIRVRGRDARGGSRFRWSGSDEVLGYLRALGRGRAGGEGGGAL